MENISVSSLSPASNPHSFLSLFFQLTFPLWVTKPKEEYGGGGGGSGCVVQTGEGGIGIIRSPWGVGPEEVCVSSQCCSHFTGWVFSAEICILYDSMHSFFTAKQTPASSCCFSLPTSHCTNYLLWWKQYCSDDKERLSPPHLGGSRARWGSYLYLLSLQGHVSMLSCSKSSLLFSYCLCSTSFHPLSETRAQSALIG